MAACQAVFGTHELIEAILFELSPFEVVTAVNVCTTWRAVIQQSALFPDMDPISPISEADLPFESSPTTPYEKGTGFRMNPVLDPLPPETACYGRSQTELGSMMNTINSFTLELPEEVDRLRHARPDQFATLPPATDIAFRYWVPSNPSYWDDDLECDVVPEYQGVFYARDGVRLRDIDAIVRKVAAEGAVSFEAFVWELERIF